MTRFADSHAHLADSAFDPDRDEVLRRAAAAGCDLVICIGESIARARAAAALAVASPGRIAFTAGVHPHDAAGFDERRDIPLLRELIGAGAAAVGECGLDYHHENSPRAAQRSALHAQLALAAETGLPLVIHSRDAVADTTAMLADAEAAGVGGVMHCFTGPADLAERALAAGWYVSFAGIVTFRKWDGDQLIRMVPDDRLLAESDSPYLAPVPHRGRRNEPAWVVHTVERLAAARGVHAHALGDQVLENTRRLFTRTHAWDERSQITDN